VCEWSYVFQLKSLVCGTFLLPIQCGTFLAQMHTECWFPYIQNIAKAANFIYVYGVKTMNSTSKVE
jgi:hypothetical protein